MLAEIKELPDERDYQEKDRYEDDRRENRANQKRQYRKPQVKNIMLMNNDQFQAPSPHENLAPSSRYHKKSVN